MREALGKKQSKAIDARWSVPKGWAGDLPSERLWIMLVDQRPKHFEQSFIRVYVFRGGAHDPGVCFNVFDHQTSHSDKRPIVNVYTAVANARARSNPASVIAMLPGLKQKTRSTGASPKCSPRWMAAARARS